MLPKTDVTDPKKRSLKPTDLNLQYLQASALPLSTPIIHCTRPFSADTSKHRMSPLTFHAFQRNTSSSSRQVLNISAPTASTKPDLPYFIDPCIEQYINSDLTELSSPRPSRTPTTSEEPIRSNTYIPHPQFRGVNKLTRNTSESRNPALGESILFNEINLERARINPIVVTGTFPFNEDLVISQFLPTRILSASTSTAAAPSPYKNLATARSIPIIAFPKKENKNIHLDTFLDVPLLTVEASTSKAPKRKNYIEQERLDLKLSYTPDILHREPVNEAIQRKYTQLKKTVIETVSDINLQNARSPHIDQLSINNISSPQEQSIIKEQRGGIPSRIINNTKRYRSGYSSQLSHRSFTTATDIYSSESLAPEISIDSPLTKDHIDTEDDIKIFTTRASPVNGEFSGCVITQEQVSSFHEPNNDVRPRTSPRTCCLSVKPLSQAGSGDKSQREWSSMLNLLDNRMYPQKV
ncbi:Hypothetical protein GLP15_2275 [Giardia lamblia P15]|uniref:Uncharacterized protein n=1 Tax=Giardia intestinalis (strain P15) TaxID=658858 RepID=E1F2V6_GIAIA|nr:Hypothetical protein GLP15_2275 [Giardia lamblia P15]